jgi:hypothetical protein
MSGDHGRDEELKADGLVMLSLSDCMFQESPSSRTQFRHTTSKHRPSTTAHAIKSAETSGVAFRS